MKQILSLIIIIAALNCYGKSDSLIIKQINSQHKELIRIDSTHLLKLNEITEEIDKVEQATRENAIAREFYSDNLTIIITFFSVIITIAIALGGFIIPKWNEKKYAKELENVKAQFEDMNKQLEVDREKTKKVYKSQVLNNSRSMFFTSSNNKIYDAAFVWAMRTVGAYIAYYKKETYKDDDTIYKFIKLAESTLAKKYKPQLDFAEYAEEMNAIFKSVVEIELIPNYKEIVENMKKEFNKKVWASVKEPEKTDEASEPDKNGD